MADFGLSLSLKCDKSHVSGVRHGTPLYIAPEIIKDSKLSKAVDLYSFGVILWELYHGVIAWQVCGCVVEVCELCRGGTDLGIECMKSNPGSMETLLGFYPIG